MRRFIFISGLAKTGWGVWLLSFNVFASSPSYATMASWPISEESWGFGFLLLGLLQMYSLWSLDRWLRFFISYTSLGLWLIILGQVALSNFASTGVPVYASLAFGCFMNLIYNGEDSSI